jgi:predicted dithiol-disulfide oxidoreductase (DUF899 family)
MQPPGVVSQEEWIAARRGLLEKEKRHMREGDALAAERRALPWVKVEKVYRFDTIGGARSLTELFDGRSQLIVHHLMYAPEWSAACPGCTFQAEHIDGPAPHLDRHDVRIIAVSRAPLDKLLAYKARMGWSFEWVSSQGEASTHCLAPITTWTSPPKAATTAPIRTGPSAGTNTTWPPHRAIKRSSATALRAPASGRSIGGG